MPSASFSSSRSYVRRSRRKGGHRIPLPSRTQSSKLFGSSVILTSFLSTTLFYEFNRITLFIDFVNNKSVYVAINGIAACFSFRLIVFSHSIILLIVQHKICLHFFITNNKGLSHCIPFNIFCNTRPDIDSESDFFRRW